MRLEHIKVGNRMEISLRKNDSKGRVYISQVEDMYANEQLLILMPISYGRLVKLPLNEIYSFMFFTEKGMYRYDGKITKYISQDNYYFMLLQIVSEGEKVQRRSFFRFNCLLPLRFSKVIEDPEHDEDKQEEKQGEVTFPLVADTINAEEKLSKGVIKDIGGGGIRFITNEDIGDVEKIKCLIVLKSNYLIVLGKVLQKQQFPKSNYKYQYRVEFIDIKPDEQAQIVKFIFDEQRKVLQKTKMLTN